MTKTERQQVHDKYGGRCAYCGEPLTNGWHVDHIEPVIRKYGNNSDMRRKHNDTVSNMNPSCASCNINKHSMTLEEFRQQIAGFMKHLNHVSTQYKLAKRYGLVVETDKPVVFYFETLNETK
jgi:5-methylcytosine-specific restriction endonuclease McrA